MIDVLDSILIIIFFFLVSVLVFFLLFPGSEVVGHVARDGSLDVVFRDRPPYTFEDTDLEVEGQPVGN
jgi:hypothetical protein